MGALIRPGVATPCREWQGSKITNGYGRLRRDGRPWLVHRWVWTLANGPIPDGMMVLHHCDNRPCFRLDHLYLGTALDNARDRDSRGRTARGGGGGHGQTAKFTEAECDVIRARLAAGEGVTALAIELWTTGGTIRRIGSGRTRGRRPPVD